MRPFAPSLRGAATERTDAVARSVALQVVHVAPGFGIGGLERMLVDFARRVDGRRFEQSFVAIGADGPIGAELAAMSRSVTALAKAGGFEPALVLRLARLLRERGADVVHTHNAAGLFYGAPAARLAGVKRIIHTRHGVEPISGRAMQALRAMSFLADRIVCVSADNADLARREGFPPEKLATLLNGVDLDRFPCRGPAPGRRALLVARLSPEKDIATLLRAAALLRDRGRPVALDIVGGGACLGELVALRDELRLAPVVSFLGPRDDVRDALAKASLFVLPSTTEGVSLTLLEAMASGLPAVATAVGGNVEVVVDRETGLLVPPSRPDALADAIDAVLSDAERARLMGLAGRRRVEERFDLGRTIAAYEALYAA